MEVARIQAALIESGGVVKVAAERLGVSRRTMNRWVAQAGARNLAPIDYSRGGGRKRGCKQPARVGIPQKIDVELRVRVERECDASGDFVSLRDASGNMVTIRFVPCVGGGSAKGEGRGRLSNLLLGVGKNQCEFIAAELQTSNAEERRRRECLERAIIRVCGSAVASQIQEEARK